MDQFSEFRLIFIGIVVETTPFLVLSALLSFIVESFVPETFFPRLFGPKKARGIILAALAGFLFPLCECCIVPIARRLIQNGVPLTVAVVFMMAAPSLNPIVIASTSAAFVTAPEVIYWRFAAAFVLVLSTGFLFAFFDRRGGLSSQPLPAAGGGHSHHHDQHSGHGHSLHEKMLRGLDEAVTDFFRVLGYILAAAVLTAAVQVYLPAGVIDVFAGSDLLGAPAMMAFAAITSTCSDADAFIAAAMRQFGDIPKLGFLLLGPVIDIKLVLLHYALLPRRAATLLLVSFPVMVVAALIVISFFIT